jgi:hypothetical protein
VIKIKEKGLQKYTSPGGLKKISIVLFVAGFFFNPVIAAIGAIGWGGITLYELFTHKPKK